MEEAEKFLKYDYAETKDLLKTFITLISATLVVSVTFSEKVVGYSNAAMQVRYTLFASWALLITALICSGIAMSFIAAAAGKIIYGKIPILNWEYWSLALTSWAFVLLAGGTYVGGLIALAVSTAQGINRASTGS